MSSYNIKGLVEKFLPQPYLIRNARDSHGIDGRLLIHTDPLCDIAEQYRSLRTNLYFLRAKNPIQTLAITSAEPADGKTVLASNLAASIALDNKKVLLVDGDMRRSAVNEFFGVPRSPGLVDVLQIKGGFSTKFYLETSVKNLFILPAGNPIISTPEFLGHSWLKSNFELLLDLMKVHFEYIIVDLPPSRILTEPSVMAAVCDAAILVVKANQTQRVHVIETFNRLKSNDVNVIATVLVNSPLDSSSNYGYGNVVQEIPKKAA